MASAVVAALLGSASSVGMVECALTMTVLIYVDVGPLVGGDVVDGVGCGAAALVSIWTGLIATPLTIFAHERLEVAASDGTMEGASTITMRVLVEVRPSRR